ncbi:hypothetical protein J3458_021209 [Metarhizium acridum]|uniref:uncharacterized protein n=1 Tax=Metarhizium acridum TaxID=92637 RepID=UPI001C6A9207|nr:hypothetical protein J3458_021209 [Metarhizium acridum]
MASKSDIEHWHIDTATYDNRVEEIHFVTDPKRNIRRKRQTVVWHFEQLLGRGGFGEVRLERNRKNEAVRAVKKIATGATLSNNDCEKELKAFLEFLKLKYCEAAVFVEFIGWFKNSLNVYPLMEYIALGDLNKNILSGLEIIYAESFAHRGLKPQSVLVVHGPPQWWVKIADFAVSKRLTVSTEYHTKSGTQPYMAPEILDYLDSAKSSPGYTNAVDI